MCVICSESVKSLPKKWAVCVFWQLFKLDLLTNEKEDYCRFVVQWPCILNCRSTLDSNEISFSLMTFQKIDSDLWLFSSYMSISTPGFWWQCCFVLTSFVSSRYPTLWFANYCNVHSYFCPMILTVHSF